MRFPCARDILSDLSQDAPLRVDPYDELDSAVIHERAGEVDDALAHYRAAESLAGADVWLLSEVLRRQAFVHHSRSEWDQSLSFAERAAAAAEQGGLGDQQAEALIAVGRVHAARGDFDSASQALERVAALTADKRITGLALHNLGAIAAEQGSWPLARQRFMESVQCFQAAGYQLGVAFAHNNYGRAALDHGNFALAADLLQHAVSTAKKVGELELVALATMNSAEALAGIGEESRAQEMATSAFAHFTATGNAWRRVECERLLGDLAKQRREEPAALQWWSGALDTARAIGAQLEIRKLEERLRDAEQ